MHHFLCGMFAAHIHRSAAHQHPQSDTGDYDWIPQAAVNFVVVSDIEV